MKYNNFFILTIIKFSMKIKFLFIIFESLFINFLCESYCRFGENCLCKICGEDKNYSNCNYYNLFCDSNAGIEYFEDFEQNYNDYFSDINGLKNICGSNVITINTKEKKQNFEILRINNENSQQFLKNENIHCYYEFENKYYKENNKNISLIIEHKSNSNEIIEKKINFFIIILLNSKTNSANIFDLNKNSLNNNIEIIELKYYSHFSLFIDVDKNEKIEESITISLNYEDNKKLSPIYILLIILGGLIFFILVIFVISIIKSKLKKNQRQVVNRNNNNNPSPQELEKKIKIQKIKQLFETELVPIYYSKEHDEKGFNGCTICLKKYRDNLSKIIILPCNHIFHYKCLYDWLINNSHWKCPICNIDLTERVKLISKSNKNSEDQINVKALNINNAVTPTSNELISLNVNTNN